MSQSDKPWMVEGLRYPSEEQALVVAERFARRYGRPVNVLQYDGDAVILSYSVDPRGRTTKKAK